MEIVIKGKVIDHIKTLHLTCWNSREEAYDCCFVIFDDFDDNGNLIKNQVIYFGEGDIEFRKKEEEKKT